MTIQSPCYKHFGQLQKSGSNKRGESINYVMYLHFPLADRQRKQKTSSCSISSKSSSILTKGIEKIIESLKQQKYRASTRQNYLKIWKGFNQFFVRLDSKPTKWEDYIVLFAAHLIDEGKQSQTFKSYISAIKVVLLDNAIEINEDIYLLYSLTRSCRLNLR